MQLKIGYLFQCPPEKAACRKGGVGTESTIMSDEIYSKADQTKFLPVVFEKDNDGMIYKPHFLKSRIHSKHPTPILAV